MKVAVIQFPGSNCERETLLALQRNGLESEAVFWNASPDYLKSFAAYILIGGFSYEDRIRSGLIAAMDPLLEFLHQETQQGKALLGICNGAQILVESGLVPGCEDRRVAMALSTNYRISKGKLLGRGFYNDWVYMKASPTPSLKAFNDVGLSQQILRVPVAHGEGRFMLSEALYQALLKKGASFYYYCTQEGEIVPDFPTNPNGSSFNLAGVSNAQGNVLALMPHPERTPEGDPIFAALRAYLKQWEEGGRENLSRKLLKENTADWKLQSYCLDEQALHFWVGLKIDDNEAVSLENSLQRQGFKLRLKRYVHWALRFKTPFSSEAEERIKNSDFLFNRQKEYILSFENLKSKYQKMYLVRLKDDEGAVHKQHLLKHYLSLPDLLSVVRENVWLAEGDTEILETRPILGNPLSHEGFLYERG